MKRNYLKSSVWLTLIAITLTIWYGLYEFFFKVVEFDNLINIIF